MACFMPSAHIPVATKPMAYELPASEGDVLTQRGLVCRPRGWIMAGPAARSMNRPMIEITGLRKSFRSKADWRTIFGHSSRRTVLAGIDLTVERGEVFGLLG